MRACGHTRACGNLGAKEVRSLTDLCVRSACVQGYFEPVTRVRSHLKFFEVFKHFSKYYWNKGHDNYFFWLPRFRAPDVKSTKYELQGEWFLSGKSNLILTERKHVINFNLKVDSDQGRLGIWCSTIKIQKNILQHPQNLCQSHIFYFEITIFFSFM